MDELFPSKKDVDYSSLKTTEEGLYSITHKDESTKIMAIIKKIVPHITEKTITDATGGIGGDTIKFGIMFKKVHSIEQNPDNFAALKHNVATFNLTNITLHSGDATRLFTWKTDVLFVDPPWGGPSYRTHKSLDLMFGDYLLTDWVEQILNRKNRPSAVFLKLPYNYNFEKLATITGANVIKRYKIRNYYLVFVS